MLVQNSGEAGLACGLEGQEPGVRSAGEVDSGFWIISTSRRSATMTMFSCVAIVETRSEVVDCDIAQVKVRGRMKIVQLSQEAEN